MPSSRQDQIIEATQRILINEGLESVTMRRVAREVGISATALYRHFRDRDAMLDVVAEAANERLGSYLFAALTKDGAVAQLTATGTAYVKFSVDHPALFGLLFGSTMGQTKDQSPWAATYLRFLTDRVSACLPRDVSMERVRALAISQWALVHGLAVLGVSRFPGLDAPSFLVLCRDAVTRSAEALVQVTNA